MNAQLTIDVRGLSHDEKEKLIFPNVESLAGGHVLKLVTEFNPLPLVYMLKARDEFEVQFEKEGPEEWILNIKRIAPVEDTKQQFKELLKEIKTGEVSPAGEEKARKLFQSVDAKTLGIVEQELVNEGVTQEEIRNSLCDLHLEALRDSLVAKKLEVSAPHPVNTLMEEHKIILKSLDELDAILTRLQDSTNYEGMGADLEALKDIAHHLVEAENHHQREEDILFPKLAKHGITEPAEVMKADHVEFRNRKKALFQLAHNYGDYDFQDFKTRVTQLGKYLTKELEGHIFKEDNIIYQIALQVLTAEDWDDVKKGCDKIGYCCFTPEDQGDGNKIEVLDLRSMPPFQRHDRIFEMWDALPEGNTLKIINDHDPKPLRYQFEAEHKGHFQWEYEQQGPVDWMVNIKKI
ncbi:MAG: DUF438 domain-containing protein [Dehalococcoidia bacterium]|nr:DUF438 domain-containing protein [Dehalococcoidia bacterium]